MGQIDTFGVYVRDRLDEWGREFALHRDCEYLGHVSKNILQVLIDHKGELPPPNVGFKPLEVSQTAHQIELIVTEIAREQPRLACVLRAYHCGSGRRKIERYETALLLIATIEQGSGGPLPSVRRYMDLIDLGTATVRGALLGLARVA